MELYTLDSLLRRQWVIDQYSSLIWTERFSEFGDFQMVIKSTPETRMLLTTGLLVAINRSRRVMEIETITDAIDTDGQSFLKVQGKELVKILDDRVATDSITTPGPWLIGGPPADIARYMFDQICRNGDPIAEDVIPFLEPGSIYPVGTIAEPSEIITWIQERDSLGTGAIKKICDLYALGFRLVRNADNSELYFDIYAGNDRRSALPEPTLPSVVFSRELDNLQNTAEFKTINNLKNVAYVYSDAGVRVVYAPGVDPSVEGFERRVLIVKSSVAAGTPDWQALLDQQGAEELAKHRSLQAFDGEVNQSSTYQYGIDYDLGDLVEMMGSDGMTNNMRVTEQIFVEDQEGERSYPTLSMIF